MEKQPSFRPVREKTLKTQNGNLSDDLTAGLRAEFSAFIAGRKMTSSISDAKQAGNCNVIERKPQTVTVSES